MLIINPLEIANQLIVLVIILFVVALMIKHWDRVLVAITGDDRIHGTTLDCIWYTIFRCCGTCSGDWTKCYHWPCCLRKWRGVNLVKEIGKLMGITTYTVELKNIVCGDLPWDRRGDFYICVECAANPPMVTSLAEEKLPKVVHFPEIMTVRLRWSPFEENVKITVKELNLLGSTELCTVHVPAMSILDWSADDAMKRFEMKPCDISLAYETPPWILVELSQPKDWRDLANFHEQFDTVRTAKKDGVHDVHEDLHVSQFKNQYILLDNTGHAIQEPLEEDLQGIEWRSWIVTAVVKRMTCWGFLSILFYLIFRVYVGSCFRRYRVVTMAYMNKHSFPMSTFQLKSVVKQCQQKFQGTGLRFGVPCNPSFPQVMGMCRSDEEGGHWPPDQPHPLAFSGLMNNFGFERTGLPCNGKMCEWNRMVRQYDDYFPLAIVLYIMLVCGVRMFGNYMVRSKKYQVQRDRAKETRDFQETRAQKDGTRSSWWG